MNMVLSVYSKAAFKEYILPSINNSDYEITVRSDYFQIQEDIRLKLEVMNEQWYIGPTVGYTLSKDGVLCGRQNLVDKEVLMLHTVWKEEISIICKVVPSSFHVYQKFALNQISSVTIGKEGDNDICYDYLGMVSRHHARLVRSGSGYRIENNSPNGIYVNAVKVNTSEELNFGAFINIMGLHMVFLGDLLAIDTVTDQIKITNSNLRPLMASEEETVYLNREEKGAASRVMYHRAPRNYEKLDSDVIEIEEPPQRGQSKKQPLFMTIGPSLTMALPMILGCVMMMASRGNAGGHSSLYMYSGLIMSVGSAAIGVVWTLVNLRYQKSEEEKEEEYRFQTYSQYLIEKKEEVSQKYEETERRLAETYPAASSCLNYDVGKGILWNRNHTHDDFLSHRLGIGEIPFQCKIEIPKERFHLYRDELAEKPSFIKRNFSNLYQVPIIVNLLEKKLIGILGGEKKTGAIEIVKLFSTQLAANNCYTDVKIGYIYDNASSTDFGKWDFAKWFPHVWSEDKKTRFVAASKEDASEVFYELTKTFRMREEEEEDAAKKRSDIPKPYYVIFVSDVALLEGELFSKYAFAKAAEYGLTTILLAERHEELPNECEFIVENTAQFQGMYDVYEGRENRKKIVFDAVNEQQLEHFARRLSSLHVAEMEEGGEIPASITFFEMLKVNRIEEYPVSEVWAKNRTYENIKGQLGERAGGMPCYLDVHEKYHGPHGLVAGTTGSGKSETLQTYLLSLAVNYSSDDIGFFIIDYKGGGMANLFEGLPHMIGQISNLSGNQVKRAMISIKSENRRRQRVFTEHGVNNINLYTKLYKNGEADTPIPHLFIVIDEFAELKREEPEFMRELIRVAQVGRSLGVHLILATQKPSGTVDDNIWSNSKFRICLRVQDQQDSKDMLHKPDAAYITQAGRGYLQVGNDEVYELFQSGFSGAVYDENMVSDNQDIAKLVTMPGKVDMTGNSVKLSQKKHAEEQWIDCLIKYLKHVLIQIFESLKACADLEKQIQMLTEALYQELHNQNIDYERNEYNTARIRDFVLTYLALYQKCDEASLPGKIIVLAAEKGRKLPQKKEKTQLDVVKEYLAKTALENGYTHKLQLWMPLLREEIYLQEFSEFKQICFDGKQWKQHAEWNLRLVLGQMDDPENQNQMPLLIDFEETGHIAICGNIVCGKSTMMQTMMYALIHRYSPKDINIYGLDFSSKMMTSYENAPHVGGIMYENDFDKIGKFFNMIGQMMAERKTCFRGGNYKQYVQVKGLKFPAIFLFVDNYASFKEKTGEKYEQQMVQISKEGVSLGIYLIVSGSGFGMNDISTRVAENISTVLCLSLKDKYEYGDLLHSVQIEVMPENGVKGRGLAYYGSRILEYQTALAIPAKNNYERMERIQEVCQQMKQSWTGKCAGQVPEIPEKPVWSQFVQLDAVREKLASGDFLPVGYDLANAEIFSVSLKDCYCYMVCGAGRTGKTNFMKVMLQSALERKAAVAVFDSPRKEYQAYKKHEDVIYASSEDDLFAFFSETLTPIFKERNAMKNKWLEEDREEGEIYEEMSMMQPYFIFISDLNWFVHLVYESTMNMKGFMENILSKGRLHNIYFVGELALNQVSDIRGYQAFEYFKEYKTGIHFGGKVSDNNMLSFEHLTYNEQMMTDKTGIGTLSNVSEENPTIKAVIPLARK